MKIIYIYLDRKFKCMPVIIAFIVISTAPAAVRMHFYMQLPFISIILIP